MRFFTEFTLSQKARPFASLRVTHGEGFRMTKSVFWNFGTASHILFYQLLQLKRSTGSGVLLTKFFSQNILTFLT
jgi:hypothetical protein